MFPQRYNKQYIEQNNLFLFLGLHLTFSTVFYFLCSLPPFLNLLLLVAY